MLLFVWMGHFEFPPNRCFIYKKTTTNVRFVMHMNSYHCGICRLYVKTFYQLVFETQEQARAGGGGGGGGAEGGGCLSTCPFAT